MTTCKILGSAVDYITVSGKSEQIYGLQSALDVLLNYYHDTGYKSTEIRNHGYTGWSVGPLSFLDNGQYGYIQTSGDPSGFVARVASGWDVRCTRIDLQVTCQCLPVDGRTIGDRAYQDAIEHKECAAPTRIQSPGGGDTVYIGSRASDRFARIYRKDAQDKDTDWPRHTWRYEIEIKKPRSQKLWRSLVDVPEKDWPREIASFVSQFFTRRSVHVPFEADTISRIDDTMRRKKTPIQRKIEWIARGVSPTVLELFAAGYASDVLEALGARSSDAIAEYIIEALQKFGKL